MTRKQEQFFIVIPSVPCDSMLQRRKPTLKAEFCALTRKWVNGGTFTLLGTTPDVTGARVGTSTELNADVLEWLQLGVPVLDSWLRGDSATECEESSDVPPALHLLGEGIPKLSKSLPQLCGLTFLLLQQPLLVSYLLAVHSPHFLPLALLLLALGFQGVHPLTPGTI